MTREKVYVSFEFQGETVLLPAIFEASVASMTGPGGAWGVIAELVPAQILDRISMHDLGAFMEAWAATSWAAHPNPPTKPKRRLGPIVWMVIGVAFAVAFLVFTILTLFGIDPLGPVTRSTMGGIIIGYSFVSMLTYRGRR